MLPLYLFALDVPDERVKLPIFYEKYKKRLMSVALSYTHNQAMAEDAIHNAFITAIQHREKILAMDEIDFFRWCVIVVKGKCVDLMRREKHYSDTPLDDYQEILPDNSLPVDERAAQQDVYARLKACMAELDSIDRQILEMKYILQMSMKEIGDELSFTPHQVNSRIEKARAKVKKLMGNEAVSYI